MNRRRIGHLGLLAIGPLLIGGCGDSPPAKHDRAPAGGAREAQAQPAPPAAPETAVEAVLAVVEGFKQQRPEAIWEFLPPGHQREINELAREFALRMDAELWRRTAGVARDSADLLKSHKRQILSHPAVRDSELAADGTLSRQWNGFAALLATLAGNELADLEKMKSFDGREFFARFDADSLAQLQELSILLDDENPFSMLREMIDGAAVKPIATKGDAATVQIVPRNGEPRKFAFVRVEGKWLPLSWASGLKEDIRRARERLDVELAPSVLAQKKKLVMPYLEDAQQILAELRKAESDESFHAVMTERIIKPALLVGAAETTGGATPVDLSGNADDAVTIIVSRELKPAAVERIADALLSGGPDRELTDDTADGRTRFVVSPVQDVEAFARTIEFGKVTDIDAARRTITVEVPQPPE